MTYLWIFLTVFLAFTKGRSIIAWTAAAYFFGWIAWLVIMFIPARKAIVEERAKKITAWAESKVAKEEMGDFNTVEDLFKQLESK